MKTRTDLDARISALGNDALTSLIDQLSALFEGEIEWLEDGLSVDGDHVLDSGTTVIDGDLTVSGRLRVGAEGLDDVTLVVLGDLRAGDVACEWASAIVVTGNVKVDGLFFVAAEDVTSFVFGGIEAGVLASGMGAAWLTVYNNDVVAKAFETYIEDGRTKEEHRFSSNFKSTRAAAMLVDEVFDTTEWDSYSAEEQAEIVADGESRLDYVVLDEHALIARFRSGEPVLRAEPAEPGAGVSQAAQVAAAAPPADDEPAATPEASDDASDPAEGANDDVETDDAPPA